MTFLKHASITLLAVGGISVSTAAWVIAGGHFDVSVSAQLPKPIHDLVHLTRVNAVKREVRDLEARPADLDDRSRLLQAVGLFEADCSGCHQPPEQAPPALAQPRGALRYLGVHESVQPDGAAFPPCGGEREGGRMGEGACLHLRHTAYEHHPTSGHP